MVTVTQTRAAMRLCVAQYHVTSRHLDPSDILGTSVSVLGPLFYYLWIYDTNLLYEINLLLKGVNQFQQGD